MDEDTLDLRGLNVAVEYEDDDPEAGTVRFLDDDDNVTGTMTFENIETVLTDPEDPDPQLDGYVEGTAGGDVIDAGYDGDPDGDMIDADDAILPGDSGDDDVVLAFSGDDTVIAGEGSDDVYGGAGNDSISTGSADQVNDHETFPESPSRPAMRSWMTPITSKAARATTRSRPGTTRIRSMAVTGPTASTAAWTTTRSMAAPAMTPWTAA